MIRWIFMLLCFNATAQHICSLDSLAKKIYRNTNVPGLSIAVIKNDSVIYQKSLGVKSLTTKQKVNANSKFYVASISKVFTGTAIMKLAEDGKIDLNAPVVKYYPEFKPKYGKFSTDSIRVIHLISHTSGLDKFLNKKDHFNEEIKLSSEERITRYLKKLKVKFKPGTQFHYSNTGFMVAQVVIEKVTGQNLSDYMAKEFFRPLKMDHSTFNQLDNLSDTSLAIPHKQTRKGPVTINRNLYTNGVKGSGGLKTSSNDFSKWLIELMKIHHNEDSFISKQTLKKMWTPYTHENGISFDVWKDQNGNTNIAKGGNFGYKSDSYFLMVPDKKFAVLIFTNSWSYNFDQEVIPFIKECKKLYL